MHITPAENITITKVVFNCSSASYASAVTVITDTTTSTGISSSDKTATWAGESDTELQFLASAQVRFSSIIITYSKASVEVVEPTTITFSLSQEEEYTSVQTVEISADGHNAKNEAWPIYYNIDGGTATAEDTPYTGPITVDKTMTINACVIGSTPETIVTASADYIVSLPKPTEPVISFGETIIPNGSEGYEITFGTELTVKSENATSIVISHESGASETIEGSEGTYTITESGCYSFEGINPEGKADAIIDFIVTEPAAVVGTDNLNTTTLKVNGSAYKTYEYKSDIATYSAWTNGNTKSGTTIPANVAFGLRTSDGYKGIVVTETNSYVKSISLTQWSNQSTSTKKSAKIYGNKTAYESNQIDPETSTLLATVECDKGNPVKYTLTENYKYIAILSEDGSLQLSEIVIEWGEKLPEVEPVAPAAPVIEGMVNGSLSAAAGTTVTITGEEGSIVYVKETRQDEPAAYAANADVDGWMTDNANTYVYTIPEYSAIVEAKSVRDGLESPVEVFNVGDGTITTGIEAVATDAAEGEAEYFNLQGIRVANPQGGVFIRRQGAKVAKVTL